MNWKSTAVLSGASLIATWFGVSMGPQRTPQSPGPQPPRLAASTVAAVTDIQQQAARLHARLQTPSDYRSPVRDPFRFGVKTAPPPPRPAIKPTPIAEITTPVRPSPPIVLAGISTDVVDDMTLRTAILSTPGGVQLVKEGETFESFRIGKIDDESIELIEGDGSARRLTFAR